MKLQAAAASTPLDAELARVAGQIAASREQAKTERGTQSQLGDSPELLAVQDVAIPDPSFLDTPEASVFPEQAFPEATDAASTQFMDQLAARVGEQAAEVKRLRSQVIPASPTYTLEEFAQVYRRYYAFISHEQEALDPAFKFAMEIMGDPYKQLGSGLLSGVGAVEGGIARGFLLHMVGKLLTSAMTGAQTDFSEEIAAGAKRVSPPVSGSASSPTWSFAELYPDKGGAGASVGAGGERSSRMAHGQRRQAETASAFTLVKAMPEAARPQAAVQAGIATTPLPIAGLRAVDAQQGWSYLVDVQDPMSWGPGPTKREHKVMPPEVVQYLLARRQQAATLATRHHPKAASGKDVGDSDIRAGGVEQGTASSAATYVRGEASPALPRAARNIRGAMTAAHEQSGLRDPAGGDVSQQVTMALVGDLGRYLSEFFAVRQDNAWRFAAVIIIANVEWQVGAKLMALLDPDNIRKMIQEALRISLIIAVLNRLGPLGVLAARGYQIYLASQGINNVAGIVSVATFCVEASTEADNIASARAWANLSRFVADDVAELFENVVTSPVTAVMHGVTDRPPKNGKEMFDIVAPMLKDPKAAEALRQGVDAHIAELRAKGAGQKGPDPDLEAMIAFRGRLDGVKVDKAALDAPLPGMSTKESKAEEYFAAGKPRTKAERAALDGALPADMRGQVPIVENPTLHAHTVEVVYDNGRVRMEVGPKAEASHVAQHVETARQLLRYRGVVGAVRRVIDQINTILRLMPGYGTRGFEARLEVQKLTRIISELERMQADVDDRASRLSGDPSLAKTSAEGQAIGRELDALRKQLAEHQKAVNSFDRGSGRVAALAAVADFPTVATQLNAIEAHVIAAGRPELATVIDDVAHRQAHQGRIEGFEQWARAMGNRDQQQVLDGVAELQDAIRLSDQVGNDSTRFVRIAQDVGGRKTFDNSIELRGAQGAPSTPQVKVEVEMARGEIAGSRHFMHGINHAGSKMGPQVPAPGTPFPPFRREGTVQVTWPPPKPPIVNTLEVHYKADGTYEAIQPNTSPPVVRREGDLMKELINDLTSNRSYIPQVQWLDAINIIDQNGNVVFRLENAHRSTGTPAWTRAK
jgi:hypothetical protein